MLGLHDPLHPQGRHHIPSALQSVHHQPQQALALTTDRQDLLLYHRTPTKSALRYSARAELDGEYLVLSAGRTSWLALRLDDCYCVCSILLTCGPELSLTVPITNSLAFLFTVLGEWYVDGKLITRDTWLGMGLVCAGIAMCVVSKT